jgi:hypothetical protein
MIRDVLQEIDRSARDVWWYIYYWWNR